MKGRDRSRGAASGRRDAGVWYPALRLLASEPEPPAAGAQMCGARRVPDLSGCSPHLCPDAAPRGTGAYTSKATAKPCEGRKQRDVPSCTQVMCSGMSCTAARACRERPLHCPPPPRQRGIFKCCFTQILGFQTRLPSYSLTQTFISARAVT